MPEQPLINLTGSDDKSDISKSIATLLDPQNVNFTTEIANPTSIATLETYGVYVASKGLPKTGALILAFVQRLKTDYVPFNRKRATEVIQVADAASGAAADRRAKSKLDKALGDLR